MTDSIKTRYQTVKDRIQQACIDAHRSIDSVELLAVSKTKPIEDIKTLSQYGQLTFGENYLQESLKKIHACPHLEWHFIGPIQSNKTKPIAENFQWVHSVDRLKIANRLALQRPKHLPALNILLEVNISEEPSKSGFAPQEVAEVIPDIIKLPQLNLRGLMAIPLKSDTFASQRLPFAKMNALFSDLQKKYPELNLDTLSMGMSADLEAAIREGATMVRIGTDLFGARDYGQAKNRQ